MNLENIRNNKLKMILQFSVPSIIAMVLTALINVVDGIFTGKYVGSAGMSAIELGLPIVYLYLAVGLMVSVGGIAIAGRCYGAGDTDKARSVFNQTMTVCMIVTVIISLVLSVLMNPISVAVAGGSSVSVGSAGSIIGSTGASAGSIRGSIGASVAGSGSLAGLFRDYYLIMLLELPVMIINSSLGMFIRGEGHPQFFMMTSILTLVLNVIFDYIFAAVLGYGIKGIAYASLIASLAALAVNIVFELKIARVYRFAGFKFDRSVQKEMIFNGSSEFIGEMTMFFSMSAYNYVILNRFGVDVLTAFTIVGFVSYIYSMIIIGFGQGIVPLVSFAFGAGDRKTASDIKKKTMLLTTLSALAIMILMVFATTPYCRVFISDENIVVAAARGILINMTSFPFAGLNCIASMYFTSIGDAKESAIISSARGLVILLVMIFALPAVFGITGLWLVSLTTELLTLLITAYYLRADKRNATQCESAA